MFITFEGVDGSGKTTQAKLLVDYFERQGKETLLLREPGTTDVGTKIRRMLLNNPHMHPETALMLFIAARVEMVRTIIQPALKRNSDIVIICDRYIDSTLVLQQDVAPEAWIRSLNNYATSGIQPDKTIFLDVSKETSVKRLNKRGGLNHYDVAFSEKAEMLRKRYYQLISYDPHRWLIVPESTMSPQEVHQQIVRRLEFDMSLNTTFDELYV